MLRVQTAKAPQTFNQHTHIRTLKTTPSPMPTRRLAFNAGHYLTIAVVERKNFVFIRVPSWCKLSRAT